MIVSSTGFGFTGSTAITDLISEYDGVYTPQVPSYELGFFTSPHGITNLYNNLVLSNYPDAWYSATKYYQNQCEAWSKDGVKMNYEMFFNGHFMEYSNEYLEKLGGDDYYYNYDFTDVSATKKILYKIINKIYYVSSASKNKGKYGIQNIKPLTLFLNKEKNYLFDVNEDIFVDETKEYFRKLFGGISKQQIINVHGMVPIQMIDECSKYFDDLRIIATERDPRDIYLTAKYRWLTLNYPCKDVDTYCKYYRWLRTRLKKYKNANVLYIRFEDLVFHYDESVKKIEDFLGITSDQHVRMMTKFIPEKSSEGCNLKLKYPEEKENIEKIEGTLPEWLYNF